MTMKTIGVYTDPQQRGNVRERRPAVPAPASPGRPAGGAPRPTCELQHLQQH